MGRVLAAADIGSNTVHLLIAETDGKTVTRLDNESLWVSLGETVTRDGCIPRDLGDRLIESLKGFKRLARTRKAEYVYVFATEAMRLATNHEDLIAQILDETGLAVDLISSRREAELGLFGTRLDSPDGVDLALEIGGGSAQISRVSEGKLVDSCSLPIGTGRLITEADLKSPATLHATKAADDLIREAIDDMALAPGPHPRKVVASGGVARGLWRALHPDGEKILHRPELQYMAWASAHLPLTRLAARFNVKNRRASTFLPGSLAYGALMDRFQIADLHVSEYGVREGAILQIAMGEIQGCLV